MIPSILSSVAIFLHVGIFISHISSTIRKVFTYSHAQCLDKLEPIKCSTKPVLFNLFRKSID